jgi:hypothetical protein
MTLRVGKNWKNKLNRLIQKKKLKPISIYKENHVSKLKDIIEKIVETQNLTNAKDCESENPHLRRAVLGNKKRAKDDLINLFEEARNVVRENCTFILVTGSQDKKFADIASEEYSCFTQVGEEFYEKLMSDINPRIYSNQISGPALFDLVGAAFEDMALSMGINSYPPLLFEQQFKKVLKDKKDATEVVTRAFNKKVGAEVVGYYSINSATSKVIDTNFEGSVVPIVLYSKDIELIKEFASNFRKITKNVFVVSTGSKIDEDIKTHSIAYIKSVTTEVVEKTLKTIREAL